MREQQRDSSESPRAQYEQLLKQGLTLQKKYEAVGKRVSKLYKEGNDDEAEQLSEEMRELSDRFDALMSDRAKLLRKVENLTTIEDAFPRVRTKTKEERKQVDYAAVIRSFNAGEMSVDDLRALGQQDEESDELTDEEFAKFCKARAQLAKKLGYKVDGGTQAGGPGNWFRIEKDGVTFSMKHFPIPSDFGVAGSSRISKFGVSSKIEGGGLNFDRGWDVACTDADVQKEIDRVVAIFG